MQFGTHLYFSYQSLLIRNSSSAGHPIFLLAKSGNLSRDLTIKPFLSPFTTSQCSKILQFISQHSTYTLSHSSLKSFLPLRIQCILVSSILFHLSKNACHDSLKWFLQFIRGSWCTAQKILPWKIWKTIYLCVESLL